MQIRPAKVEDISAIEQVEQSLQSPWSQSHIASELHQLKAIQLVAFVEKENNVIGWCCARMFAPEAELLKITVIPRSKRTGVASLLLHHLIKSCDDAGCNKIFLEVREKNQTARSFYEKIGFRQKSIRKKYYSEPADNALILRKTW